MVPLTRESDRMVDDGLWPVIKAAVEWLVLPLTASVAYSFEGRYA